MELHEILDAMPKAVVVVNQHGMIVFANNQTEVLFGCPRDELLGEDVGILVPERCRGVYRKTCAGFFISPASDNATAQLDLYGLRKDGREFPAEADFCLLKVGAQLLVLSAFHESRRYHELFENANDVIFTQDLAGNFTSLNRAGEQLFGYTRGQALKMNIAQVVVPEHVDKIRELSDRAAAKETAPVLELDVLTRDGRRLTLEVSARAICQEGNPIGLQGIGRDVSKRKLLERQLLQAQRMEAVARLAGGVAHDFNNLLTIVTGYSDLMLEELGPDDSRIEYAKQIRQAIKQAALLTSQLSAFSRKQIHQPRILDLNLIVTDCAKMLGRLIGEDIQLVTTLASNLGKAKADPGQIEQVIMNLAVNARDAMPQGGKLMIETTNADLDESYVRGHVVTQPGEYVMLAVSDTGHGMNTETQLHIFEPFFTTKEEGKGTGLGLAIVYGIVKQSNGYIYVYSEPGHGTTFKIYLPQVHEAAGTVEPLNEPAATGGPETILVVEDEEKLQGLLGKILRAAGYRVLAAQNAAGAMQVSGEYDGAIHLLVTDVVMPGMNGRELARSLATQRPEMKVLCISGYTDDSVFRYGVVDPGMPFLQKPFRPDDLLRKVRKSLDQC